MTALFRQAARGSIVIRLGGGKLSTKPRQPLFTGIDIGKIRDHTLRQCRQLRDRHGIFARSGPQPKQPLLDPFQLPWVIFRLTQRRLDFHLRIGKLVKSRIEQRDGIFQKAWCFVALALETTHQRGDMRHGRCVAVQEFRSFGNVAGNALGLHHPRALFSQLILFAILRRELFQLLDGRTQIVRLAGGSLYLLSVLLQGTIGIAPDLVKPADLLRLIRKAGKCIEKNAMRVRIDKCTIVMLAMNLDKKLPDLTHELNAERLIVDEGLGPAIGRLDASENQVAVVIDVIFAQELASRMLRADIENRSHLTAVLAMTHKPAIAAPAKGQRQTVKQDGFARTRFAGQHRKPGLEGKIQPLDQNDIADRKLDQHLRSISRPKKKFLARPGNPRTGVFARLYATLLQQLIGILIPAAVRIVVTKNGGCRLRLGHDTHCIVGFDESRQGFFDLVRRRILFHDHAEAGDRSKVVLAFQIVAADLHFLAGELVAGEADLFLRVADILRLRIGVDELSHRLDRLLCRALVLRHVHDLLGKGRTDQVLHIVGIFRGRILLEIGIAGLHCFVIATCAILHEGAHDECLARPFREGLLLVDRIELLAGFRQVACLDIGEALIVEHLRRIRIDTELGDVDVLFRITPCHHRTGTGQKERYEQSPCCDIHAFRPCKTHRMTVP